MALMSLGGTLVYATPSANALLARLHAATAGEAAPQHEEAAGLPPELWSELATTPMGQALEWHPPDSTLYLGCTRYHVGDSHVLVLMREITERKLVLAQRLHEQRLEATGRLVATIAHDLRAPLASIVFSADMLAGRSAILGDDAARESLQDVRAAAGRLQRTIDGLLDFARLGPPVSVDVALADIFERLAGLLRPMLREGGHHLLTEVAPDAAWTRGNPLILEQVFVNLVINAVEAAPGAALIHIASRPENAGRLRVEVRDDGPGIPPALRERIFTPFFTTKARGTGLGLTLAREAAHALGGDLTLAPSDAGACFVLRLPTGQPSDGDGA